MGARAHYRPIASAWSCSFSSHTLHSSPAAGSPHEVHRRKSNGGNAAWSAGRIRSYPRRIARRVPGESASSAFRISRARPHAPVPLPGPGD